MEDISIRRIGLALLMITGLLVTTAVYCEEGAEQKVDESAKIKTEIRELLNATSEKNEKANTLFKEATTMADSLKQEAAQKLEYLAKTIKTAQKSRAVNKKELVIAVKLNKEAIQLNKEFDYVKVIEKVNEALKHISKKPVVSLTVQPRMFSPDGDGDNDVLNITTDVFSINKVKNWILAIQKKEEGDKKGIEIKSWKGEGEAKKSITWDGKEDGKIAVDSAGSYIVRMVVKDDKNEIGYSPDVKFKTDIFVINTPRGKLINISSIKFAYNKADLKAIYKKTVKMVYDFLLKMPGYSIVVEGHSDSSGKAWENKELSSKRAKSVGGYLVELGMNVKRIKRYGLGEALPKTYTGKKMGLNRRVSFILLKTEADRKKYEDFIKTLKFSKEVIMKKP